MSLSVSATTPCKGQMRGLALENFQGDVEEPNRLAEVVQKNMAFINKKFTGTKTKMEPGPFNKTKLN